MIFTGRLAKHANKSAESSAVSARAAERALLLQAMPLYYPSEMQGQKEQTMAIITCLESKPAFKLQVSVEQLGREALGPQEPFVLAEVGKSVYLDLPTDYTFDWKQPYTARLTYLDATGTAYRTQRIGYIDRSHEVTVELWDDETRAWRSLV